MFIFVAELVFKNTGGVGSIRPYPLLRCRCIRELKCCGSVFYWSFFVLEPMLEKWVIPLLYTSMSEVPDLIWDIGTMLRV